MNIRVPCEQFVYSKYAGAPRSAPYTIIAKSSGITENMAITVRSAFNGCRPISTALFSYDTSYAVTSIGDGKLALLRLDVNKDLELKNSYILHERYLVISEKWLRENITKPWQFLNFLPTPETIYEHKSLPNFVGIPSERYQEKVNKIFDLQKKDFYFESIFIALYSLLNSHITSISSQDDCGADWLSMIETLIPMSIILGLRLFAGTSTPRNWRPNLAFLHTDKMPGQRFVSVMPDSGKLPSLVEIPSGYTGFILRCFTSRNVDLLLEVLSWADALDLQVYEKGQQGVSDDLLLNANILPESRLKLIRSEFENNKRPVEDLYWLWKNRHLSSADVKQFLPVLLVETLNQWSIDDFIILREFLEDTRPREAIGIFLDENISVSTLINFMTKWGQWVKRLSDNEKTLYLEILFYVAKKEPEKSLLLLFQILKLLSLNDFKDIKRIFEVYPSAVKFSQSSFWEFIVWLFCNIKTEKDVAICVDILSSTRFDESQIALNYLAFFLKKKYSAEDFLTATDSFVSVADRANMLSSFLPALLNVTLIVTFSTPLIILALSLQKTKLPVIFRLQDDLLLTKYDSVISSNNEKYISAYIFLLSKVGYNNIVKEILTRILIDNSILFIKIVDFAQENFPLPSEFFSISTSELANLPKPNLLRLLFIYCISTVKKERWQSKLHRINSLLMSIESLDGIETEIIEKFLSMMIENKEWDTARKILEHQIRDDFVQRDIDSVRPKLRFLSWLIGNEYGFDSASARLRSKIIISYVRALPDHVIGEFLDWLIHYPLSQPPPIQTARFQPFTTKLLVKHVEWFRDDPVIRYHLFEEISRWNWH